MKHIKIKIFHKKNRKVKCLIAVLFLIMVKSYSSEYNYSAVNGAMAGAYSAIDGDVNSLNINPAGITTVKGAEINASWGKLYSGLSDDSLISHGNINFVFPFKYGLGGFSWNEMKLSDAYSESVFNVAFATSVYKELYNGINFKYFRKNYSQDEYTSADPLFREGYSKSAISFDLGSIYKYSQYSFSWVIKNINQPDIALSKGDKLKIENILGVACHVKNSVIDVDILLSDKERELAFGIANRVNAKFELRGGINIGNNSKRVINAGLGWDFNNFSLDYSFSLPVSGLENSGGIHKISFGFKFFKPSIYEETADTAKLKKDLEDAINSLREMQNKYESKQNQINELEKKITQQNELIKSIKEASKVEKVYVSTSTDVMQFEMEIDYLKKELEQAKKEKRELSEKMEKLEQSIKIKKEEAKEVRKAEPKKIEKSTYIVEKGDTLQSIAQKVYGDSSKWIELYKANQKNIGREGEIKEGQVLVIP